MLLAAIVLTFISAAYAEFCEGRNVSIPLGPYSTVEVSASWTHSTEYLAAMSSDGKVITTVCLDEKHKQLIYSSKDYGMTWKIFALPESSVEEVVASHSGQYIIFIRGNGGFYLSSDYGDSWQVVAQEIRYTVVASNSDGQVMYAAKKARIDVSFNYGQTWTSTNSPTIINDQSWQAITCSASGQFVVAATRYHDQDGEMYISSDFGTTWTQTANNLPWRSIAMDWSGQYISASFAKWFPASEPSEGGIFVSSDYGKTWTKTLNRPGLFSLSVSQNALLQVAADFASGLYFSSDRGGSWQGPKGPSYWETVTISSDGSRLIALNNDEYYPVPKVRGLYVGCIANTSFLGSTSSPTFQPSTLPTFAPSAAPFAAPTAAPTSAQRTRATLSGNCTIAGITAAQFDADYAAAFEEALEDTALGGKAATAHVKGVSEVRSAVNVMSRGQPVRAATDSHLVVLFNVSAIMEETGLTTNTAFDTIYSNLKTASSSGNLQTLINDYVKDTKGSGAVTLSVLSLISSKKDTSFVTVREAPDSSSDSNGLSTTNIIIIIAVVIGGLCLIVLVGLLVYYVLGKKQPYERASSGNGNGTLHIDDGKVGTSTEMVVAERDVGLQL